MNAISDYDVDFHKTYPHARVMFKCGKCGVLFHSEEGAEKCCTEYKCKHCGKVFPHNACTLGCLPAWVHGEHHVCNGKQSDCGRDFREEFGPAGLQ